MGSKLSISAPLNTQETSNTTVPLNQNVTRLLRCTGETGDTPVLLWLDASAKSNNIESLNTRTAFLEINRYCLFYDDGRILLNDIEEMRLQTRKPLLVISGSFADNFIGRPNMKETIPAIIIFCKHSYKYEKLRSEQVVDICTDLESLKQSIRREMSSLKLNLCGNQVLKSIRTLPGSKEGAVNTGVYFTYLLFIELFKQMSRTKQAKEAMVNKCRDFYRGDKKNLADIEYFDRKYTSDQAIEWYVKESFVYRLVNRAFRTDNISLWYSFRFYIVDLCIELERVYQEQRRKFGHRTFKVYRGQAIMPISELNYIKANINGGLIATNGFLSASKDRHVAVAFASNPMMSNEFKSVVYEIDVDTRNVENLVFVEVLDYVTTKNKINPMQSSEDEVLFNIGSVFRVLSVQYDDAENLWCIGMQATDEGTNETKKQIHLIKEQFETGNMNLLFGRLLLDTGHYVKADSYFQMMLQVLPKHHEDLASVYDSIGDMNMRKTHWKEAFRNFEIALKIKKTHLPIAHPSLAITLNNIGNYYKATGNCDEALEHYRRALHCENDQINHAITQLNIAAVHALQNQYAEALKICQESFSLFQVSEPSPHMHIMVCQGILGDVYLAQGEYDTAEAFYLAVHDSAKKFLFIGDYHLVRCINALADIYEKKAHGNRDCSIDFCQKELTLHQNNLPDDHPSIAHILMKLGQLTDDINYYQRALKIFDKQAQQEYAWRANCLMFIGEYNRGRETYEQAINFYTRAHVIHMNIYPANHSLAVKSGNLIIDLEKKLAEQSLVSTLPSSNPSL